MFDNILFIFIVLKILLFLAPAFGVQHLINCICFGIFCCIFHRASESHQPSGLRWFRFKTLPIFQLGGFTLPPTPFPGLWFEAVAGCNRIFFRCSFRAPFFSPLGTPKNRYHKLFRHQNDFVLGSKTWSKTSSYFETGFFSSFLSSLWFSLYHLKCLPYSACHIQTTFSPL